MLLAEEPVMRALKTGAVASRDGFDPARDWVPAPPGERGTRAES